MAATTIRKHEYALGEIVFLRTDVEQIRYQVTGLLFPLSGGLLLRCETTHRDTRWCAEEELTRDRDTDYINEIDNDGKDPDGIPGVDDDE